MMETLFSWLIESFLRKAILRGTDLLSYMSQLRYVDTRLSVLPYKKCTFILTVPVSRNI